MAAPSRSWICSAPARWLPRALAGAVLAGAMLASMRIHGVAGSGWSAARTVVVMAGALLALGIVRYGAWAGGVFTLSDDALELRVGKVQRRLEYEQIVSLGYDGPFAKPRQWIPALILIDRFGVRWRVPALLDGGGEFVAELLRRSGRDDLATYADAYRLVPRMERARGRWIGGYAVAAAILAFAVWLALSGPR